MRLQLHSKEVIISYFLSKYSTKQTWLNPGVHCARCGLCGGDKGTESGAIVEAPARHHQFWPLEKDRSLFTLLLAELLKVNEINSNRRSPHTSSIDPVLKKFFLKIAALILQVSIITKRSHPCLNNQPWPLLHQLLWCKDVEQHQPQVLALFHHPAASTFRFSTVADNTPWSHFACFHKLRPHFCIQTLCGTSYPSTPPFSSHLSILSSQPPANSYPFIHLPWIHLYKKIGCKYFGVECQRVSPTASGPGSLSPISHVCLFSLNCLCLVYRGMRLSPAW